MHVKSPTSRNIKTICEMEQEALNSRTTSARVGDWIAGHAGRLWFIILHAVWFVSWILVNTTGPVKKRFDPYPFSLLTMIVSLESIFLSLFIIMSQTRSQVQADRRNHLDLQVNLLSEDENTKMLQMLRALCDHHGLSIAKDKEITDMAEKTQLNQVLDELKAKLPPS